ncbi:unnamed protein product [Musa acuminata subsp. malaccensis]|uniref:(wild Malaysian banana) hypothetical protein n=1 Tax=Musa acuminata subsp. malaccensis TaxID=214687 RepID=A0A8D7FSY7_MUSAM|nr:unnamed protein product [Musa acuminata subsp. malaccensis]
MPPQDGAPDKDTNLGSVRKRGFVSKISLHFSQRRWSLAEGKSEASLFSTTLRSPNGSDTMIEIIEDKNNII